MRIREITFKDFRSFRGERRISFVDPVTDTVRPVTVLAGSNGCGKTTVLDTIEAMLALGPGTTQRDTGIIKEVKQTGLVRLVWELSPDDLLLPPPSKDVSDTLRKEKSETVTFSIGRKDLDPDYYAGGTLGKSVQLLVKLPVLSTLLPSVPPAK